MNDEGRPRCGAGSQSFRAFCTPAEHEWHRVLHSFIRTRHGLQLAAAKALASADLRNSHTGRIVEFIQAGEDKLRRAANGVASR